MIDDSDLQDWAAELAWTSTEVAAVQEAIRRGDIAGQESAANYVWKLRLGGEHV